MIQLEETNGWNFGSAKFADIVCKQTIQKNLSSTKVGLCNDRTDAVCTIVNIIIIIIYLWKLP
jgi:hypothetical protein